MGFVKKFGKYPDAKRETHFQTLSNYRQHKFQNPIPTPPLAEGVNMLKILWKFFRKQPDTAPQQPIPHIVTDLKNLDSAENVLVWFGHSSYFIQADGRRFLIDPVFSGNASPVPGSVKAFPGADDYKVEDLPDIDVLLISHDHWDHLDYPTIQQLKNKIGSVICALGVARHFEYWGWKQDKLIEKNWYEHVDLGAGFSVTLTPARHFSGRLFKRNASLWTSFALKTPTKKLFLGGDSGYSPHFKAVGEQFGPFDLAVLECGQYNSQWPYIHSFPEDLLIEATDLNTRHFMPVHHSKFKLSNHPWYEPLQRVTNAAEKENKSVTTPKIGEKVNLDQLDKSWEKWWEALINLKE
ncbi:MAG: MBL fold metallo-hydrolase [Crocinitomicaceae bacterium]|nr:MBL fold metallo-hydrolase [Crocinitomicaceae bacterium]